MLMNQLLINRGQEDRGQRGHHESFNPLGPKLKGTPRNQWQKWPEKLGWVQEPWGDWSGMIWSTNLANWEEELISLIKPWKRGCYVEGQSFVFSNLDNLQASFGLMRKFSLLRQYTIAITTGYSQKISTAPPGGWNHTWKPKNQPR